MRLLIIGGSVFLGWHLVEAALARGDAVTLFNRGRSASPRSSKVEQRQAIARVTWRRWLPAGRVLC